MRITSKDLDILVLRLNKLTKNPETYSTLRESNIGHYCLDPAFGGVRLVQVASTGGAVNVIIDGFGTKSELHIKMQAYISGVQNTMEKSQ